jgi:hypothetical protein
MFIFCSFKTKLSSVFNKYCQRLSDFNNPSWKWAHPCFHASFLFWLPFSTFVFLLKYKERQF